MYTVLRLRFSSDPQDHEIDVMQRLIGVPHEFSRHKDPCLAVTDVCKSDHWFEHKEAIAKLLKILAPIPSVMENFESFSIDIAISKSDISSGPYTCFSILEFPNEISLDTRGDIELTIYNPSRNPFYSLLFKAKCLLRKVAYRLGYRID